MRQHYFKQKISRNLLLLAGLITLYVLSISNVLAQTPEVGAQLACSGQSVIMKGESAQLDISLQGQAPFQLKYTDGMKVYTVYTSESQLQLQVNPSKTTNYSLVSMNDANSPGTVCGEATIAVKGSTSSRKDEQCLENCFETEIVSVEDRGDCKEITLKVSTQGDCNYELSHFNVTQGCGVISNASNTLGKKMEIGNVDPTTQIKGLKVDNISNFGGSGYQEFFVTYTLCPDASCDQAWLESSLLVAYKAGQCVYYDDLGPIQVEDPLLADINVNPISCFGAEDGSAQLSIIGGQEPYTVLWSNEVNGVLSQENLPAGSYSVLVTDQQGQSINIDFEIASPDALALVLSAAQADCENDEAGKINAQVSGGTAPYTYLWSNGGTFSSIQDITTGEYEVTVTDANGCQVTGSINYSGPVPFGVSLSYQACEGVIVPSITGGTAPYTYYWNNGSEEKDLIPGSAGQYTLVVQDAQGCTTSASIDINQIAEPLVADILTTLPDCSGEPNGSLEVVIANGSAPFTYLWNTGANTATLDNVGPGMYSVLVTDAFGCSVQLVQLVEDPGQLELSVTQTTTGCGAEATTQVSIEVIGSAEFSVSWEDGFQGAERDGLTAGTYQVLITSADGCEIVQTIEIQATEALAAVINYDACSGGVLQPIVSGGIGDYSFEWSNGSSDASITVMETGTYSVTIRDEAGCQVALDVVVDEIFEALEAVAAIKNVSCFGGKDGGITLTISGTDTYTVVWSHGPSGSALQDLAAGSYTATITASNGCSITRTYQVRQPNEIRLTGILTQPTCADANGGAIRLVVDFGTAPYTYSWSNGASTRDIDSLSAGSYTVEVTDARGCTASATYTINDAPVFSASIQFDACTNLLSINTSGGSGPYTYVWGDGSTNEELLIASAGTYTVQVTDAQGCVAEANINQSTVNPPLTLTGVVTDASCENASDGAIQISASGGTSPYSISWSNGSVRPHQTNLAPGTYTAVLTDANGCRVEETFVVGVKSELQVNAILTQPDCDGGLGAITLQVSGATGSYTIAWASGDSDESLSSVEPGTYSVTISDESGCSISRSYTIVAADCEENDDNENGDGDNGDDGEGNGENSDGKGDEDGEDENSDGGEDTSDDGEDNSGDGENGDDEDGDDDGENGGTGPIGGGDSGNGDDQPGEGDDDTGDDSEGSDDGNGDDSQPGDGSDGSDNADDEGSGEGDGSGNDGEDDQEGDGEGQDGDEDHEGELFVPYCQDQSICLGEAAYFEIQLPNDGLWLIEYTENNVLKQINAQGVNFTLEVYPNKITTYTILSAQQGDQLVTIKKTFVVGVNACESASLEACKENCFETNMLSVTQNGNCVSYELEVYADGTCSRELSHFNVAIPEGRVTTASNSRNWKMELNALDPTTGVYGFKVDNISGFGKKGKEQSFTVSYTVCFDSEEQRLFI